MNRLLAALLVLLSFHAPLLAAEPVSAFGELIRLAPDASQPVPIGRLTETDRRIVSQTTLLVRFKKSTVITIGTMRVEAAVTDGNALALIQSEGLSIVTIGETGLWHVVSQSRDAEVAAERLEARNIVLFATPKALTPPKERRLFVKFKKTLLIDIGGIRAEVGVSEDDIARVLHENGLKVLEERGEGGFVVMTPGRAPATADRLAAEKTVLTANPES